MVSLFDFLGRKAGPEKGLEVATIARENNIFYLTRAREISNPKFTGEVNLYPREFLEYLKQNGIFSEYFEQ